MKKICSLALAGLLASVPALAGEAVFGLDYGRTKVSDSDLKGTGLGVYAGYRFNESFGVEFGYRRLFRDTEVELGIPFEIKGSALQASALAFLPLGNEVSLFGRLGVNRVKAEASSSIGSGSDSETKALVGVGLDYSFSKSTALRVEFQKPTSDASTLSLGVKFSF